VDNQWITSEPVDNLGGGGGWGSCVNCGRRSGTKKSHFEAFCPCLKLKKEDIRKTQASY
jgi:hypothetical protein